MASHHEDRFDPEQPALFVAYGTTNRRRRPLEKDVVVLGRSPCCDIGLASAEVAPVHCVISRGADGWRIRDCSGRAGTRVNGESVQEGPLADGDLVQVGMFTLEAHLPAPAPVAAPSWTSLPDTILVSCENFQLPPVDVPVAQAAPDVRRTQRSRRKLARLALAVRKRLRIAEATIARQERRLKEHDECVHQLEELENDLAARREMLEASQAAWEENRARAEEALMRRTMVPTDESGRPLTDDDAARSLKIRAQELAHLARHLQNREQQVSAAEARCREQRAEIETLRLQLLNREAELATKPIAPAPSEPNWEDELVQLRGELERDRAQLNSQIERLKERQEDLEAASKEAELEMSRERAQIGRDRAELMRLRDDIRFEQQKSTRNGDAHDRLETIRRLKDELARSSDHGETTRPNTDQGSHPNANRWRNLRGLNGESLG